MPSRQGGASEVISAGLQITSAALAEIANRISLATSVIPPAAMVMTPSPRSEHARMIPPSRYRFCEVDHPVKSHCLRLHYRHQIEYIRSAEEQLLEIIAWLKRYIHASGFPAAVADLESCCRQRRDCLSSFTGHCVAPSCVSLPARSAFLETTLFEILRSDTARAQALALCLCAALDRHLINAYRIARKLAASLDLRSHVRRLDGLMGALGDRNLCWRALPGSPELQQPVFVSG